MKWCPQSRSTVKRRGFTLVEMSVVVVCLVVMGVLFLSVVGNRNHHRRDPAISCINNLKNIGLAARIFAADNGGLFPWQVSTNEGGSMEYHSLSGAQVPGALEPFAKASDAAGSVWAHMLTLSNELSTPKTLHCPSDRERETAPNFAAIFRTNRFQGNRAVSYFLGLDAREKLPDTILAGDRNLAVNHVALTAGYRRIPADQRVKFSPTLHNQRGNLLFGDGSVHMVKNSALPSAVAKSAAALNRTNELWLIP